MDLVAAIRIHSNLERRMNSVCINGIVKRDFVRVGKETSRTSDQYIVMFLCKKRKHRVCGGHLSGTMHACKSM